MPCGRCGGEGEMAYEIPKDLRYEEKVIFNLSLMQAAWIGISALLAFVLFTKTAMPLEFKVASAMAIAAFGAGFAFFGLAAHMRTAAGYFSAQKESGFDSPQTARFLEVRHIDNDAIILDDGSLRACIEIRPINFHILSQSEQQAIISAYRDFLNSLDFPVQIVMRTCALSIEKYLMAAGKKAADANGMVLEYWNNLSAFIKKFVEEKDVKDRRFYLIIPADTSLKGTEGIAQLEVRSQLCIEKLRACRIRAKRLTSAGIVAFLSTFFQEPLHDGAQCGGMITTLFSENCKEGG